MNNDVWIMLFEAALFGFIGYMIGEVRGYYKGIKSACRIWEKSFTDITTVMTKAVINK